MLLTRRHGRRMAMSSAVAILWSLLTIIVAAVCSFSFMQPIWVIHPLNYNALGIYGYCVQDPQYKDLVQQVCGIYGGPAFHFSSLPSSSWQAACVLYGGGCLLLAVCALLAIVSLCAPAPAPETPATLAGGGGSPDYGRRVAVVTGYVQTIAVMLLVLGLLVFPMGLDSRFVSHYCQGASTYWAGDCEIGWAYMLAIVSTALAVFCPFLAHYTDMKIIDDSFI